MQRQTLLERALHLVTVRSLLEKGIERTAEEQQDLRKVIVCKQLMAPISEGLALYTQFDYFPANFYIAAGGRSPYDGFIEFLVARREIDNPSDDDLPEKAWHALSQARLSGEALRKKRALLDTPFLIIEDHVTGYLIIKSIICNIRCGSYPFYVHDGLAVPLVMSLFYNCPQIIKVILDPHIGVEEASAVIQETIRRRLQLALRLGNDARFLDQFRGQRMPDFEHDVALDEDREDFNEAVTIYGKAYDTLVKEVRTSVGDWIRDDQSLDDYIRHTYQGKDGDAPYPISAVSLLSSPHFGRLFSEKVRIKINADTYVVELSSTGQRITIDTNSTRAETYGWVVGPPGDTDGVLGEAIVHLHGLQQDFFSVSFVSHDRGLLTLRHNTIDKNIGWFDIGMYLKDAYRIDQWLARINEDFAKFEASNATSDLEDICEAKIATYSAASELVVDTLIPGGLAKMKARNFVSGRDVFESREKYEAFIAFSIAVRFADFGFESSQSCRNYVAENLSRFPKGRFDERLALRFLNRRNTACTVKKLGSSIQWYSFSCRM